MFTPSPPDDLQAIAAHLGAHDLFVFRRITDDRFVHVGGVGRGEGWAGIVELHPAEDILLQQALTTGTPGHWCWPEPRQVFGPYYARSALLILVSHDVVVIFGHPQQPLPTHPVEEWQHTAALAAAAIATVSPAKRLADELEVLHAVQHMMTVDTSTVTTVMAHIVHCAAAMLSCEIGLLYLPAADRLALWTAPPLHLAQAQHNALRALLGHLRQQPLPLCEQDSRRQPLPPPLDDSLGIRAYYALPVEGFTPGVLLLLHTDACPRGFTQLCQELGNRLAGAASSLLHTAHTREQLQIEIQRLSQAAHHDALTGLGNRLAWEERLANHPYHSTADAVIALDMDNLKLANDTYGHAAGDALLQAMARVLATAVRDQDQVARVGGDEFLLLLPATDEAGCRQVVARIETALKEHPVVYGLPLAAAIGYAVRRPDETLQSVQYRADAAMYAHKQASRSARPEPLMPLPRPDHRS